MTPPPKKNDPPSLKNLHPLTLSKIFFCPNSKKVFAYLLFLHPSKNQLFCLSRTDSPPKEQMFSNCDTIFGIVTQILAFLPSFCLCDLLCGHNCCEELTQFWQNLTKTLITSWVCWYYNFQNEFHILQCDADSNNFFLDSISVSFPKIFQV